jgi:hypothetical protein
MENCAEWNSLEIAKLVIPVITTILFGVFALWLEARFFDKLEDARWFSHKIINLVPMRCVGMPSRRANVKNLNCFYVVDFEVAASDVLSFNV